MTQTVSKPATGAPVPQRRARRFRAALVAAVLLAGAVVAVSASLRYLHADPLTHDGGLTGWVPPDDVGARTVTAGSINASVAPLRQGYPQSFELSIENPSSVTQTVLGLAGAGVTSEPDFVSVSTTPEWEDGQAIAPRFRRGPVDLAPGSDHLLRYTVTVNACWGRGRSNTYSDLRLRVRVGAFTRTETIHFGQQETFVLEGVGCAT